MKNIHTVLIVALLAVFATGGGVVFAASTPNLGIAAPFGILSSTYTNTAAGTSINGNLGFTTGPLVVPTVSGTTNILYSQAGIDQGATLGALNAEPCTTTIAGGADLSTDITHGPIGIYTPGVYCITGAASIGAAGITLDGSGTYIFRLTGALTSVANSVISTSNGASVCDVFWTPGAATTLGANSTFLGTVIDDFGITIGSTVTWNGRALSFGGTVSTDVSTINAPVCPVPPVPVPPAVPDTSSGGIFYNFLPEIAVTKTPNVSSLPSPFRSVTYAYAVTNPGKISLSYVKLTDDKCPTVEFVSGDANTNAVLETTETWVYVCSIVLTETTTNTATATGVAIGSIAHATAQAAVTVAQPTIVPAVPQVLGVSTSTTPGMPNAGFGPMEHSTALAAFLLIALLGSLLLLSDALRKKLFKI